jgi:hypothetical protein
VVEEAHRLGLSVTAHAHALAGVQQCVAAGVDGIEHCSCVGTDLRMHTPPGLAAAIAAAGIAVCPTLGHDFSIWPDGEPPPEVKAVMRRHGFTVEAEASPSATDHDPRFIHARTAATSPAPPARQGFHVPGSEIPEAVHVMAVGCRVARDDG